MIDSNSTSAPIPTRTAGPTPTRAPLTILVPTHNPDASLVTPTPDRPRTLPTPRQAADQHVVAAGDTLGSIAEANGISVEALEQANGLSGTSVLSIGQTLNVPPPHPVAAGSAFKIIPDF